MEILFDFIYLIVIGIGIALVVAIYAAGAAAIVGGIVLITALGWIPIVICMLYENYYIGVGFFGSLALWALYIYTIVSIGIIIAGFVIEGEDDLPVAFRIFALFYRHPTEGMQIIGNVDNFLSAALQERENKYLNRIDIQKMEALNERKKSEAERIQAAADVLEAEEALEKAKRREARLRKNRQ